MRRVENCAIKRKKRAACGITELFSRQTLNECHYKRNHTQKKADPTRSAFFVYYERAYMAAFNPASLPVTNADVIL
ncbi:hypothetical protein SRABI96_00006 [Peribacillus sp. Bi96]|nr:hypothetical protein SRABI96_00006 [Peribacillus sp. Bi96]